MIFLVYLLFFLSGLAGLIYQLAWSQQITLIFGSTEPAIATVLAAYMAGLALGSYVISMNIKRIKNTAIAYAVFEALIAISALLVPFLLIGLDSIFIGFFSTDELASANNYFVLFYLFGAFAVLLVPTFLMGATLPLLIQYTVQKQHNPGEKVGKLYAINTLGACMGAIFSSFVLLPEFGLKLTVWFAVFINFLVFLIGLAFFRGLTTNNISAKNNVGDSSSQNDYVKPESSLSDSKKLQKNKFVLVIMMLSGMVALSQEVIWTRLLSHILGGSIYSFGVMLFVFLGGIGLGSYLGSWLCKKIKANKAFVILHLLVGLCFWFSFVNVEILPQMVFSNEFGSIDFVLSSIWVGIISLFPGALLLGALFPVAVLLMSVNPLGSAEVTARLYSWNTIGAIFGALIMGFYLLPYLGFTQSSRTLALISVSLSLIACFLYWKNHWLVSVIVLLILTITIMPANPPYNVLKYSVLGQASQPGKVDFFAVGQSSTVLTIDNGNEKRLLTNGLPESAFQVKGSHSGKYYLASWLSMLPVLARPQAKKLLVIGLGAGKTVNAVPESVESISLIELEEEVLKVNQSLSSWRQDQPLQKENLNIVINDARNALKQSRERFDAIVSQPSHPWTSGAANLYTVEFFNLVEKRLNDDGVFVQWIGMKFVDSELFKSLLGSLNSVFEHVELFQPAVNSGLVFIASNSEIGITEAKFKAQKNLQRWKNLGISGWEDFVYSRRLSSESTAEISKHSRLSSDAFNVLKIRSPKVIKNSMNANRLDRLIAKYDPYIKAQSEGQLYDRILRLIVDKRFDRAKKFIAKVANLDLKKSFLQLLQAQKSGEMSLSKQQITELLSAKTFILEKFIILNEFNHVTYPQAKNILSASSLGQIYLESQRSVKLKKWFSLKSLDEFWTGFDNNDLLYPVALQFRYKWRSAIGDWEEKKQSLVWVDELLAKKTNAELVMERLKTSIAAKDYYKAFASLLQVNQFVKSKKRFKNNRPRSIDVLANQLKNYAKLIPLEELQHEEHKKLLMEMY